MFLFKNCSLQPCDYWERADQLALLCVMFSCVFVTFPYGVPGQVWYLIISIPDLCLFYFLLHVFHSKVISWNICKKNDSKIELMYQNHLAYM